MPDWNPPTTGLLVVVSGPSAVGKDTVLDALLATHNSPQHLQKCVTVTTRAPRPRDHGMEIDGVDYHFVTLTRFHEMVKDDDFLEYADVHGSYYGTPKRWVEERRAEGVDIILKIDVQGGIAVKKQVPDSVMIFLRPPSFEELERRLRARRTETEEKIAVRLLNARSELSQMHHYDYAVINDTVPDAVSSINAILLAEHFRIRHSPEHSDVR